MTTARIFIGEGIYPICNSIKIKGVIDVIFNSKIRRSQTPIKKYKKKKFTKEQKKSNRELNRLRIAVEHVNRRQKIFKILSYPYRNRHRRFGLRSNLIAGIYNYELAL